MKLSNKNRINKLVDETKKHDFSPKVIFYDKIIPEIKNKKGYIFLPIKQNILE